MAMAARAAAPQVDEIFINKIREAGLYDQIWQAFAVFLPVRSVGVQARIQPDPIRTDPVRSDPVRSDTIGYDRL